MGSRSNLQLAYIAGFLDGDGSLMLQIKNRSDSEIGIRFMATICLYQDTRYKNELKQIREFFAVGYLSDRNDGITELRINGFATVHEILSSLQPYIRFKQVQTQSLIEACEILKTETISTLDEKQLRKLVDLTVAIQEENYSSTQKKSKEELLEKLGLTP